MKTPNLASTVLHFTSLVCFLFPIHLKAQKLDEENQKILSQMDTESFSGKIVLNKAMAFEHQLEPFGQREKNKDGANQISLGYFGGTMPVISVKPCHFKRSYNDIKKVVVIPV